MFSGMSALASLRSQGLFGAILAGSILKLALRLDPILLGRRIRRAAFLPNSIGQGGNVLLGELGAFFTSSHGNRDCGSRGAHSLLLRMWVPEDTGEDAESSRKWQFPGNYARLSIDYSEIKYPVLQTFLNLSVCTLNLNRRESIEGMVCKMRRPCCGLQFRGDYAPSNSLDRDEIHPAIFCC